jgi:hypothetical protein
MSSDGRLLFRFLTSATEGVAAELTTSSLRSNGGIRSATSVARQANAIAEVMSSAFVGTKLRIKWKSPGLQ